MREASSDTAKVIRENWLRVSDQVAQAAVDADRAADSVRIVAASKYVGPELAAQLVLAGCRLLGENRPQALWEKHEYFHSSTISAQSPELSQTRFDLIGHLQRNKIRRTLPMLSMLHSLDNSRLATCLSEEARRANLVLPALVEVNVSQDASKTGLAIADLPAFIEHAIDLPGLRLCGLMAMSSLQAEPHQAREEFEQVRQLRDRLEQDYAGRLSLPELSMGMSGDFPQAIAAGATLVRIGSSLWQGL